MINNINIEFFILCFSSLFALINPLGIVPIFITITQDCTLHEKNKIALKAILFSFIILIIFSLIGDLIFSFYGITIHAFRIAGGILLFKISLDMIESKRSRTRTTPAEIEEAEEKHEVAYSPLGVPLIAGPGAIASIMILSSEAKNYTDRATVFIALIIVLLIITHYYPQSYILTKYKSIFIIYCLIYINKINFGLKWVVLKKGLLGF